MRGVGLRLAVVVLLAIPACGGGERSREADDFVGVRGALAGAATTGGGPRGSLISMRPAAATFSGTAVGTSSPPRTFVVALGSGGAHDGSGLEVALDGPDSDEFQVVSQSCTDRGGASLRCTVAVVFVPQCAGSKQALLRVSVPSGREAVAALRATAVATLDLLAGMLGGLGYADGVGDGVRFRHAESVAADGAGSVYVADSDNEVIRKIDVVSGLVTTFAGTPGLGGSADGPLGEARFGTPVEIVSDGGDNLYVADLDNTIRRIAIAAGVVTTLAGTANTMGSVDGVGADARFEFPEGLGYDGAGHLYVSEWSTIRRVDVATGAVVTIAGSASQSGYADGTGPDARFESLRAPAFDGAGNLYVGDSYNSVVRKVALDTGVVTTWAGQAGTPAAVDGTGPDARFLNLGALAADGAGNLYLADAGTVRKLVLATGAVSTVAGMPGVSDSVDGIGSDARFSELEGLSGDAAGNIYVADDTTIRLFVPATAAVSTLAGLSSRSGTSDGVGTDARFGWLGPGGMAADGAGSVYVADPYNHAVRRVEMATGLVTTAVGAAGQHGHVDGPAAVARLDYPTAVALDGAGDLFVSDSGNYCIRKVARDSGEVSTFAGGFVSRVGTDGVGLAAGFRYPTAITADDAENLYVCDGNSIRKIVVATAAVTTLAGVLASAGAADGIGAEARFDEPSGLAAYGGYLYVADSRNYTIRRIDLATAEVTTLAGSPGVFGLSDGVGADALFQAPSSVTSDGAGSLYVADPDNHLVRRVSLDTGAVTTGVGSMGVEAGVRLGSFPARLNHPSNVVAISPDALVIVDESALLLARF